MFAAALVAQDYIGGQVGIEAEDSRQPPVLVPQTGDFKVALCLSLGWYCPFVDAEPLLEIPGVDIEVFFGLGSGAKAVEHALTGIAQQAEVARVFVKAEGQCGVEARFEIQDFVGDDVDGGIPRDALPVAAAWGHARMGHPILTPKRGKWRNVISAGIGYKEGKQPMCVELYPMGALKLIPLDDAEPSGFLGDPLVRYTRPSLRFYRGT